MGKWGGVSVEKKEGKVKGEKGRGGGGWGRMKWGVLVGGGGVLGVVVGKGVVVGMVEEMGEIVVV